MAVTESAAQGDASTSAAYAGYMGMASTARGSNAKCSRSVNRFSDFSQYQEWSIPSSIRSWELGLKIYWTGVEGNALHRLF